MQTRRTFIATSSTALLAACAPIYGTHRLRYRLKLTLSHAGRTYTSSSVMGIRWDSWGPFGGFGGGVPYYKVTAWAEAITFDIVGLGLVFGLLETPSPEGNSPFSALRPDLILHTFLTQEQWRESSGKEYDLMARIEDERDVPSAYWPGLVRFRDISDRSTAEFPSNAEISVTRATIEVTSAPLTHGIEHRIPWLRSLRSTPWNIPLVGRNADFAIPSTLLFRQSFIMDGFSP